MSHGAAEFTRLDTYDFESGSQRDLHYHARPHIQPVLVMLLRQDDA